MYTGLYIPFFTCVDATPDPINTRILSLACNVLVPLPVFDLTKLDIAVPAVVGKPASVAE